MQTVRITPLRAILSTIAEIDGVDIVMVTNSDGVIIDAIVKRDGINADAVARLAASLYTSVVKLSENFGLGELEALPLEYSAGSLLLTKIVKDRLLVVAASKRTLLGRIRIEIKRNQRMLRALF